MDIFYQLLLQFILILLNAFFAATEIAIISLNEKKVKARAEEGDKKAAKMLNIIKDPTKFLSTIQIGITLAGFLGSAFAADNFAERLSGWLVTTFNVSAQGASVINTVSVILITLILSYFTLVLGELVPKRWAMKHKEKLANGVCGVISVLTVILKPVIWFLTVSTNGVLRLFGVNPNEEDETVSEEDIVLMLDAGGDEGTLNKEDIKYIKNVFKLDGMTAEDVMTPRMSVVRISETAADEEIMQVIKTEGYSRIPVYSGDVDNIIGVLYAREYLLKRGNPDFELRQILKEPVFIPKTKHLDVLFKEMQKTHTHIVILIDEYGMTTGIVTMEDILEELVGEIWDEQDEPTELIIKETDATYRVKTNVSLDTFFDYFNLVPDHNIKSATVNGWIIETHEDIPDEGYSFAYDKLVITVTKVENMQTQEIKVEIS
ncbi:MAG: HlyC/CorC family transporter [Clostridiales bacterium]|nr:HlyC/CorC family transporter [Clostridiales bacterium]